VIDVLCTCWQHTSLRWQRMRSCSFGLQVDIPTGFWSIDMAEECHANMWVHAEHKCSSLCVDGAVCCVHSCAHAVDQAQLAWAVLSRWKCVSQGGVEGLASLKNCCVRAMVAGVPPSVCL
jgi:hypothetical protein